MCESRKFSQGVLKTFLFIIVFHRGRYEPPSRSNWTQGVQLLLEGVHTSISKEHLATCDFSGGWGFRTPCPPLDPPMHIHIQKVSKGAKIRNRHNHVPHLTQDTNGKVTNSQKTPQTRAKRSALSQQVTTKHI